MLFIHLDQNCLVKPLAVKQKFNSDSMFKNLFLGGSKVIKKINNNDGKFEYDTVLCF